MATETQHEPQTAAPVEPVVSPETPTLRPMTEDENQHLIATDNTMTPYQVTVGQLIEAARADIGTLKSEAQAKERAIADSKVEIAQLTEALAAATKRREFTDQEVFLAAKRLKPMADLERLPGGGISLRVVLDQDEAAPLLSWADSAGEDPGEYIQKQLREAIVAYSNS